MRIYLIRHGETTGDVEDRFGGDYDDHLTGRGRSQCADLAERIIGKGIEIIYHSPKIRARETAEILAQRLGVSIQQVDDIRERNHYGILTGMRRKEAMENYPEEVAKLKLRTYHDVRESEDYDTFKARVTRAFDSIAGKDHKIVGVVSHGGPICCIVREVLKLGELKPLNDCAFLEIERDRKGYRLIRMDGAELEE